MDDSFASLTALLVGATSFAEAAAATGRAMLDAATDALEHSPYAERGRMLRAMVHVRPDDGYRRLAVIEHDDDLRGSPLPAAPHLPSGTAWRWVVSQRCAVSIETALGRVQPHAPGAAAHVEKNHVHGDLSTSKETRDRLLERQASHVLALPLRMPGGAVDGMISMELSCRAAMGKDVLFALAGKALQTLADVAAAYLVGLPQSPVPKSAVDELLPVIGPTMAPLIEILGVFAEQEETLLLSGPTGAGKSRLSRWCKERSPRRGGPFEVMDLASVPEELQMAELFGWRRGAFTGAVKDTVGCVARAEGGTLFIDEIDKLSMKAQAGLLHLLEERAYRPLGEGAGEHRANVRFVVGTNANLPAKVSAGQFREDLYYRINVLPIKLPPLDERADEIAPWAEHMLNRRHRESSPSMPVRFDAAALRSLVQSRWPGNLRQLDNVVRRAYVLSLAGQRGAAGEIVLREPEVARALAYEGPRPEGSLTDLLREAARRFVIEAEAGRVELDHAEGWKGLVLAAAAEKLGSKEEALRVLGKEALLRNRNHHKPFRKEIERALGLYSALGEEARFPYREWLEEG